ncbi:MAG: YegS/Rv2252/BmrU family lipid kinase [Bacteroidetes bacterium]|nr:MAG: YegS/Rv2252/BmrU family lipid kinase [Bacteroidota bacterium]
MSKKILYISNPISGSGTDRQQIWESLKKIAGDSALEKYETKGKNDKPALQQQISNHEPDMIWIGGGDGTIRMVADAMGENDIRVGIIPIGSANGLAKCLDIHNLEDAYNSIKSGKTQKLDILKINDEICLHLCDFGFNAGLIKKFEEENERGMMAYFKSSLRQFQEMRPYTFHLEINGEEFQTKAKMLIIANGDMYGTGAIINPAGKIDDGTMEIIALNPDGFDEMAEISLALFRGNLDESESVRIWSGKKAIITNPDNADFQIDGEIMPETEKIEVICEANKYRFFSLRQD